MIWSDAAKQEMAKMWNEGNSASIIGAHFKVSKNVVIGLAYRNRAIFLERISVATLNDNKVAKEKVVKIDPKKYDRERMDYAKHLTDLERCECRWPLTDRPFLFCASEVVDRGPYCSTHKARSVGNGTRSERAALETLKKSARLA